MLGLIGKYALGASAIGVTTIAGVYTAGILGWGAVTYNREQTAAVASTTRQLDENKSEAVAKEITTPAWPLPLDIPEYDTRLLALANYVPPKPVTVVVPPSATNTATTSTTITPPSPLRYSSTSNVTVASKRWPPSAPYPNGGAILPFKRILAYYGNFYSRQMGILGEYDEDEVVRRLASTTAQWEVADPSTPVLPAIEYIAMVAQADAGSDGMYRAVMPTKEVDKAYALAERVQGILILDLQWGLSTIERELPKFEEYWKRPDVHVAIDPEFAMYGGHKPGSVIGTIDATDVNYAIQYLTKIVQENKLPPKTLFVHRFTNNMVTGASRIKPTPEVQVVMIMDGWGSKDLKRGTYNQIIEPEPVQFTGIKLFYKNDLKAPSTGLLTPKEVLDVHPKPIYVQYQ